MIVNLLLIIVGIALVLLGANLFTDGASRIATLLRVPQIVIGLTIVAVGTSLPEFCISLVSALRGNPGMAVGNVVGSNIFNTLLIVGVSAAVAPIEILRSTVRKDIPIALTAALVLSAFAWGGTLSRLEAVLLLVGFGLFMAYTFRLARTQGSTPEPDETAQAAGSSAGKNVLFIVLGIASLIAGSQIFVQSASSLAQQLHVSGAVIGLTIVAGGTSLPELATSVVSARKGQSGIAIGNVVGSNVLNILLILGATGAITPLQVTEITTLDFAMLIGSSFLLWFAAYTKYKIERWEGLLMCLIFAAYMALLVYKAGMGA